MSAIPNTGLGTMTVGATALCGAAIQSVVMLEAQIEGLMGEQQKDMVQASISQATAQATAIRQSGEAQAKQLIAQGTSSIVSGGITAAGFAGGAIGTRGVTEESQTVENELKPMQKIDGMCNTSEPVAGVGTDDPMAARLNNRNFSLGEGEEAEMAQTIGRMKADPNPEAFSNMRDNLTDQIAAKQQQLTNLAGQKSNAITMANTLAQIGTSAANGTGSCLSSKYAIDQKEREAEAAIDAVLSQQTGAYIGTFSGAVNAAGQAATAAWQMLNGTISQSEQSR